MCTKCIPLSCINNQELLLMKKLLCLNLISQSNNDSFINHKFCCCFSKHPIYLSLLIFFAFYVVANLERILRNTMMTVAKIMNYNAMLPSSLQCQDPIRLWLQIRIRQSALALAPLVKVNTVAFRSLLWKEKNLLTYAILYWVEEKYLFHIQIKNKKLYFDLTYP